MESTILKISGLSKQYTKKSDYAVKDISFEVQSNSIVGILGHNGAGKSTILKAITGVHSFNDGLIEIDGINVKNNPIACKKLIGYVSDNHLTFEKMTGKEYINFIANIYKVPLTTRESLLKKLDVVFELGNSINSSISSYSHGMKQKIAIIASLIHSPKLWILDEPTNGLDPQITQNLLNFMKEYKEQGNTILFSSHHLESVAHICTKVILLSSGNIVKEISMENNKNGLKELQNFFNNKSISDESYEAYEIKQQQVVENIVLEENTNLIKEVHNKSNKYEVYLIDDYYVFFKYFLLNGKETLVKTIEDIKLDNVIVKDIENKNYEEIKNIFKLLTENTVDTTSPNNDNILYQENVIIKEETINNDNVEVINENKIIEEEIKEEIINSEPIEDNKENNITKTEEETNNIIDENIQNSNSDLPFIEIKEEISSMDKFMKLLKELHKRKINGDDLDDYNLKENYEMKLLVELRGGRFSKFKVYEVDSTIWIYKYRISNGQDFVSEVIEDISLDEALIQGIESKKYSEIKEIFNTLATRDNVIIENSSSVDFLELDTQSQVVTDKTIDEKLEQIDNNKFIEIEDDTITPIFNTLDKQLVVSTRGGRFGRIKVYLIDDTYCILKYRISSEGVEYLSDSLEDISIEDDLVKNITNKNYFELKDIFYQLLERKKENVN